MYLTSHGIEIYNVQSEKRQVRSVRQMHQLIHWFVYCPTTSILIVSPSSKATSTLHLFQIKSSNVYKLPRIDLAFDHSKVEVREKDCHGMFLILILSLLHIQIFCEINFDKEYIFV